MINFRPGDLAEALSERTQPEEGLGAVAKRDLGRYYAMLRVAGEDIRFTRAEASLICDALNGIWLRDARAWQTAWAEIADHIQLNGAAKHDGVQDPDALVRRLREMHPAAKVALVDAVERFWRSRDDRDAGEVLADVGLLAEAWAPGDRATD